MRQTKLSEMESLLLKRIEKAKQEGRDQSTREQRLKVEREQAQFQKDKEQRVVDMRRAQGILNKIPAAVRDAEKWNRKQSKIMRLSYGDFTTPPPTKRRQLKGTAKLVFEACQRMSLNPEIVKVSDACMEDPDAGSHEELQISWN